MAAVRPAGSLAHLPTYLSAPSSVPSQTGELAADSKTRYHDIEANTVSHRASDEYKAFRRAVGEEALLERPSDLRFWHPTGIGFMNRGSAPHDEGEGETIDGSNSQHYIVVDELMPHPGSKSDILGLLKRIADVAEVNGEVRTFWVLDRVGTADQEAGKEGTDDGIYVIGRFTSKQSYDHYLGGLLDSLWKEIDRLCESRRNTTWIESGIGFIGR